MATQQSEQLASQSHLPQKNSPTSDDLMSKNVSTLHYLTAHLLANILDEQRVSASGPIR